MQNFQIKFLEAASKAAADAGHIFPEFAAAEGALESGYGTSYLDRKGNNLFGMKQHAHPSFGTLNIPTKEFLHNEWVVVNAAWVAYPTLKDCFADRMNTLRRLAGHYLHYAAALAAKDGVTFITEVSKTWSTDPDRAKKVLAIHAAWQDLEAHGEGTSTPL